MTPVRGFRLPGPPLLLQTGVEPLLTKGALTILEHAFKHLALKTKLFLTKL